MQRWITAVTGLALAASAACLSPATPSTDAPGAPARARREADPEAPDPVATEPARQALPTPRSIINFRDIGGALSAEGGRIALGLAYRSGHFEHAADDDLMTLVERHRLGRYIDMRSLQEGGNLGRLSALGVKVEHLPMDGAGDPFLHLARPTAADWSAFYWRPWSRHRRQFGALLRTLATASEPVVYGCSLGKDRTGIATALLLWALRADDGAIYADYAASGAQVAAHLDDFRASWEWLQISREDFRTYWLNADPQILRAFMQKLHATYPTPAALFDALGLTDIEVGALRQRFWRPALHRPAQDADTEPSRRAPSLSTPKFRGTPS